jgi:hypothetical protein
VLLDLIGVILLQQSGVEPEWKGFFKNSLSARFLVIPVRNKTSIVLLNIKIFSFSVGLEIKLTIITGT